MPVYGLLRSSVMPNNFSVLRIAKIAFNSTTLTGSDPHNNVAQKARSKKSQNMSQGRKWFWGGIAMFDEVWILLSKISWDFYPDNTLFHT